jgi:transcriptional regulator with XRE-family HTH domain
VIDPQTVDIPSVYRQDQDMRLTHPPTLKALIRQRGLSYSGLAGRVGCNKQFIGHLAVGRKAGATTELAQRIAEALEVPLDVLFVPAASTESGDNVHSSSNVA